MDRYKDADFYGAHVKWNLQGDRLMLVLRGLAPDAEIKMTKDVITMEADGSDIRVAIPSSEWAAKGGHHPNWCPDGETVLINLNIDGEGMRFVSARYDGSDYGAMHDSIPGSGHPSLHSNARHMVTDAYPHEKLAFDDGTSPIRLADLEAGTEENVVRIQIVPPYSGPKKELRVDPHPAWDYEFKRVAFNACPDGTRRVYVADLTEKVEG